MRIISHFSNGAPFSTFSDLRVFDAGTLEFEEDFAFAPEVAERVAPLSVQGWQFTGDFAALNNRFEWQRQSTGGVRLARTGRARRVDPAWGEPQLELHVMVGGAASM
jgi:hypothetical protein